MPKGLKTPDFQSETEEAQWWAASQDNLLGEFETAAKDGSLGHGTAAKRAKTPTTTIRLDPKDIEIAKKQAEQLGLKYQTYLKMIIHQALQQRSRKA